MVQHAATDGFASEFCPRLPGRCALLQYKFCSTALIVYAPWRIEAVESRLETPTTSGSWRLNEVVWSRHVRDRTVSAEHSCMNLIIRHPSTTGTPKQTTCALHCSVWQCLPVFSLSPRLQLESGCIPPRLVIDGAHLVG